MGEMRNTQIFVAKPERKRPLGRRRRRFEHNIEMVLRELVDRIHLAQYRDQWSALVEMVMSTGSTKG
jgi:hypothetical protein